MFTALDPAIRRYRLTVDDVERMVESGILGADARVELVEGELVAVSPQGPEHASGKGVLAELLQRAFGGSAWVRNQDPLRCGEHSLPEPDLAVVRGRPRDYMQRHPRGDEAILVVEISRTSQRLDRRKAAVYAEAGVPEYWLIDLVARCVTVHREPGADGYAQTRAIDESGELELADGSRCSVRDLL
ncbi:MAG: Uma2 family endonuclease [Deltaproteobacteria bacterium]|nr:Uma2 family endonuclease [Nannocystaceae bacterium]